MRRAGTRLAAAAKTSNTVETVANVNGSCAPTRHRLVGNFVVDLPFGEGRRFGSGAPAIARKLISGWSVNGVVTIQSGFPLAFTATPNLIGSGCGLRPNVDPNCDKNVRGS